MTYVIWALRILAALGGLIQLVQAFSKDDSSSKPAAAATNTVEDVSSVINVDSNIRSDTGTATPADGGTTTVYNPPVETEIAEVYVPTTTGDSASSGSSSASWLPWALAGVGILLFTAGDRDDERALPAN